MSETFPGLPPPPPPSKPRDASVVVLYRQRSAGLEVFWIRRDPNVSFGGFYAFPGGGVDASDLQVAVGGAEGPEAYLRAAAARELFEETGVLVARGVEKLAPEVRAKARRELNEHKLTFPEFLTRNGLTLRASEFRGAGRWVTPPFSPKRFDARMFLVELPPGSEAEIWPGEATEGGWIKPADALAKWEQGQALLHPPQQYALEVMSRFTTAEDAAAKLSQPPYAPNFIASRIEFQRGIRLFPLETPTLPPAAHTNAYVLGNGELLIVDPGSAEVRQYARLLALVAGLKAEGKRPLAVLLTHHHLDHIGGARAVKERLGVPLWCHERCADRLDFPADRLLRDGEEIVLNGMPPMRFTVLHTPGHARGHLCLVHEPSKAAIVGDMVAGMGTIVIDPPEGDMAEYLTQLQRLRDLPAGTLYAAHGPTIVNGPAKLDEYIRHRQLREHKVLSAVPKTGALLEEITLKAYDDTPAAVLPVAERSCLASLIKLAREGKVVKDGEKYRAV
jgi:ribonuclease/clavin/mitogillin